MADTTIVAGLIPNNILNDYFEEYVTEMRFSSEMGTGEGEVWQVKENFSKGKGDAITFSLVNKLTNSATTGSAILEGNEEDMDTRSFDLTVDQHRHAIRIATMEEWRSGIDLFKAGRSQLKTWSVDHTNDKIVAALGSINGTAYASASEASKDAWLADNSDRVLFGAAKSNNSSNDHSASLANIDNTNDKLTPAALSLMKEMALAANPRIRPIRSEYTRNGRRYFIVYANSRAFRDLKNNSTITQAQREVSLAMENERLFKGGDLYWDGMIIKEIDELPIYTGVGAGSIDVGPVYLCGAQAGGLAWAKRWNPFSKTFDYGDKTGVGIGAIYEVAKFTFGSGTGDRDDLKDHGVVTGYFAAVASS